MKILVFGAGAIGSAFGGFLSPFHEVTLLGRAWHLGAIRKRGLRVEGIWGRHRFRNFQLATEAHKLFHTRPFFDLILMTVKTYDTQEAARFLQGRVAKETLVLSLQNGIGNVEALHRFLLPTQVLAGRVIFGVEIQPGRIKITVSADKTRIGETKEKRLSERVKRLARVFSQAGLPTEGVSDIEKELWSKLIYNSALNPLASLLGVHYGILAEYESTRFVMNEIIQEACRVAKRKRIRLKPPTPEGYLRLFYRKLLPDTSDHHPSMLYDLQKRRRTEIDALNGAIVRLGKSLACPTPFNELLADLIRSREVQ